MKMNNFKTKHILFIFLASIFLFYAGLMFLPNRFLNSQLGILPSSISLMLMNFSGIFLLIRLVKGMYISLQNSKSKKLGNSIFMTFGILSVLFFVDILLYIMYKMSIAGYYSDRILFWLWFFSFLLLIIYFWKTLWAKILCGLLTLSFFLSILPMGIIFFGFILSSPGEGLHYKKQISPKYRFEVTNYGIMARPFGYMIENKGILEKEIPNRINSFEVNDSTFVDVKKIENIEYISENKNQILLKVTDEKQNQLKVNFSKTKTE